MKRSILVLLIILLFPYLSFAEDIYIAQSSAGNDDGANCANTHSVTWFNDAGNWANPKQSGEIGSGDTVRLCGTISTTLTIQNSGSSGSPITVYFEPNAKLSKAYWDYNNGAIYALGKSYITIDGGTNGIIESIDNGTAKAYQMQAAGIKISDSSNWEINNLSIRNMYVRTPRSSDSNRYGYGIVAINISNIRIHHSTITEAYRAISTSFLSSSSNIEIDNNNISRVTVGIMFGNSSDIASSVDNVKMHDNRIFDLYVWGTGTWGDPPAAHHVDGILVFTRGTDSQVTNLKIYNNYLGEDYGTSVTAWLSFEGNLPGVEVYNNVFVMIDGTWASNGFISIEGISGAKIFNNTFYSTHIENSLAIMLVANSTGTVIKNNIFKRMKVDIWTQSGSSVVESNYNIFYEYGDYPTRYDDYNVLTFSDWQGLGFDANSITNNPLLNSYYRPLNNSPAKDAGISLSDYFTTDKDGVSRPQNLAWDIGAYEYKSVAPSPPANPQIVE